MANHQRVNFSFACCESAREIYHEAKTLKTNLLGIWLETFQFITANALELSLSKSSANGKKKENKQRNGVSSIRIPVNIDGDIAKHRRWRNNKSRSINIYASCICMFSFFFFLHPQSFHLFCGNARG